MDSIEINHPLLPVTDRLIRSIEQGDSMRRGLEQLVRERSSIVSLKHALGRDFQKFEAALVVRLSRPVNPSDQFDSAQALLRQPWQNRGNGSEIVPSGIEQTRFLSRWLEIVDLGLQGQSVISHLKGLKTDIENQMLWDLRAHLDSLPQKASLPVLCCALPSYLVIALWPVLKLLVRSLGFAGLIGVLGSGNSGWASTSFRWERSACRAELTVDQVAPVHCWITSDRVPAHCEKLIEKAKQIPALTPADWQWLSKISPRCAVALEQRQRDLDYRRSP